MAHVVTESCNDCKYTDCCVVCPVECFYQDETMLYIDPNDCIDCEACVPECPVNAIYAEEDVPADQIAFIKSVVEQAVPFAPFPGDLRRSASALNMTICIQPASGNAGGFGFSRLPEGSGC